MGFAKEKSDKNERKLQIKYETKTKTEFSFLVIS